MGGKVAFQWVGLGVPGDIEERTPQPQRHSWQMMDFPAQIPASHCLVELE